MLQKLRFCCFLREINILALTRSSEIHILIYFDLKSRFLTYAYDFPSWLSASKNQPCFINNRGFTERYFSDKVHASLIDWWLHCVTAPVSVTYRGPERMFNWITSYSKGLTIEYNTTRPQNCTRNNLTLPLRSRAHWKKDQSLHCLLTCSHVRNMSLLLYQFTGRHHDS